MIMWGIVVGAVLGWIMAGFDGDAIWPGGAAGAAFGWWLRGAIRREIARERADIRAEMAAWFAPGGAAPVTPEPAPATGPWAPAAAAAGPADAPPAVVESASPAPVPPAAVPVQAFAAAPAAPPLPAGPNAIGRAFAAVAGWLLGGNMIVRVGVVLLFVGLSFLARHAAAAGLFPIELRLALVAAAGIALLGIGFARRLAKPEFALTLQGAGVAILYLTVFAAAMLFDVLPPAAAFPLMILVCGLGCALALLQDSQVLAATSFAGGFAVPILLAGAGGPWLFGYYTVLNLAVLGIAWRRAWRAVNLIGFVATFGIATLWGVLVYDPSLYGLSQFFLILFVLIYVAAGILHAQGRGRSVPGRVGVVDGTLLFGPALAGFGLQAGLVRHVPFGGAFSALGFGALYLALALLVRRRGQGGRVLTDGLIAVATGFVTLAVPLALGVRWTATVWALEGAGAFWLGLRQARWLPRAFALALQAAAGLVFLAGLGRGGGVPTGARLDPDVLGAVLIALPAFAIAWWLRRPAPPGATRLAAGYAGVERALPRAMFVYGFLLWCVACALAVGALPALNGAAGDLRGLAMMLAFVVSAGIAAAIGRRLAWDVATWPGRVTLAALVLALIGRGGRGAFVPLTPDWTFWLPAVALHYRLLWLNDRAAAPGDPLQRAVHVGGAWLLAALLVDGLWLGIDRGGLWRTSWAGVVLLAGGTATLLALTLWAGPRPGRRPASRAAPRRWPLAAHAADYRWFAAAPVAVLTFGGAAITALLASGETAPLPYVPLLNPVDLALALALATLALWRRAILSARPLPAGAARLAGPPALIALAALGFVAINTAWLRIAHQLLGIGWSGPALLGSFTVQTGLSILWTLLALGLTLTAHRRGSRPLWLAGAVLLGVTVAKLLLIDLSNADGAARIVTFIVVGILMLVVGYFAPLPPQAAELPPAPPTAAQPSPAPPEAEPAIFPEPAA